MENITRGDDVKSRGENNEFTHESNCLLLDFLPVPPKPYPNWQVPRSKDADSVEKPTRQSPSSVTKARKLNKIVKNTAYMFNFKGAPEKDYVNTFKVIHSPTRDSICSTTTMPLFLMPALNF